jgi:hypothetical protein
MKEEALIVGKLIRPVIDTPVAVAKENEPGRIVKRNFFGRLKYLSQTLAYRHG